MVKEAINSHEIFETCAYSVYAKGSYRNNTNVRLDSDVDIVVELDECFIYEYTPKFTDGNPKPAPYEGAWENVKWRNEVVRALQSKFGASDVNADGNIAVNVKAISGSRPSIDIVPSFKYHRYADNSARLQLVDVGSCVYPKLGEKVINWPQQQLDNGINKNAATGGRYKNYVRALKNAENKLAEMGTIKPMPSYFMECLIYNVTNASLSHGNLDQGFKATLVELYKRLKNDAQDHMLEPNERKYLFHDTQKWEISDGIKLVETAWLHLGYGNE